MNFGLICSFCSRWQWQQFIRIWTYNKHWGRGPAIGVWALIAIVTTLIMLGKIPA